MISSGRLRWAGQGRVAQEEGPGLAVRLGKPLSPVSFPEQETRPRAQGLSQSSSLFTNTDTEAREGRTTRLLGPERSLGQWSV